MAYPTALSTAEYRRIIKTALGAPADKTFREAWHDAIPDLLPFDQNHILALQHAGVPNDRLTWCCWLLIKLGAKAFQRIVAASRALEDLAPLQTTLRDAEAHLAIVPEPHELPFDLIATSQTLQLFGPIVLPSQLPAFQREIGKHMSREHGNPYCALAQSTNGQSWLVLMRYNLVFEMLTWRGDLETSHDVIQEVENLLYEHVEHDLTFYVDAQGALPIGLWFDRKSVLQTADLWLVRATYKQYDALLRTRIFTPEHFETATLICIYAQQVQS